MLSQRIVQHSARRLATRPVGLISSKFMSPTAVLLQVRTAAINSPKAQQTSNQNGLEILVAQRLNRPVAPHLTIYRPQITWILSSAHRVTGLLLSGPLYIFALGYLAAPLLGWSFGSAAMVASLAKWPAILKIGAKTGIGFLFAFKCLNGIRHLVWDTGMSLKNDDVIKTGWAVVGLSVVSALGLALFL